MDGLPQLKKATLKSLPLGMALAAILFLALLAADPVPFSDLTPAQAAEMIKARAADPLFAILDVRTAREFAENRIQGAKNIDVKAPDFKEQIVKLDRKGIYLAYCKGGVRSARAMNLMKEWGFKTVYNLGGGVMKWQAEKLPLETGPLPVAGPAPAPMVRARGPNPGTYSWLQGRKSTAVPFRLAHNRVHVEAEFAGGKKLDLILDTGMPVPGVLLFDGPAVRGLDLAYAGEARVAGAGGGSSPARVAMGVSFRVGDLLLKEQTAIVKAEETASDPSKRGVDGPMVEADGVIGYALLGILAVAIDYDRMVITLSDAADFSYQGQGSRLPLILESNFPFIECPALLADGRSVSLKLIADLGASHALSLNIGSQPGLQPPDRTIPYWGRGAGGEVSGRLGRIRGLTLGKFVLRDPLAGFHDARLMPLEKDGNLGSDALRRFNLVFDYSRQALFVEPNSHFAEPFEAAMSGFQAERDRAGELFVSHVLPASPASEAGLLENDRIVEVNGRPAAGVSADDLLKASTREGETLELSVQRGETRFTAKLKLRRLI